MKTQESITETSNDQEVWKPVVGYAGIYEVSSHGRVRSVDRVTVGVDGVRQRFKGRIRKPWTGRGGYRRIRLARGGEMKNCNVHRLVFEAFVGPIPEGMHVDHIDNDPANNCIDNLQTITPRENNARKKLFGTSTADLVASGKHHHAKKSHCPNSHPHFEGNNIPGHAKQGQRACLICKRARDYLRWRPDFPESMKWAVYDYQLERFLLEEA